MIVKIGIDLVHIPRMRELVEREAFLARTFHPSELRDRRPMRLAGIFAAKEALFKALGAPHQWLEVEVDHDPEGRPFLRLSPASAPPEILSLDLSVTHEGEYAVAVVVALLEGESAEANDDAG
ncbi:MAG TPA: holo-ACP synthase [Chloroflexota bacterium]|nr:holo-ACP synthase [Chloroflexota bacterium]HEX2987188.1 holo-ACP synthase [Chloroflexota bacterium]